MSPDSPAFDLSVGVVQLTAEMVDIHSVSGQEQLLADKVEATLRQAPHLEVIRSGNTVAARTALSRPQRVIIAGHLDTVPLAASEPARVVDGELWGRGSVDMKGGLASHLILAVELDNPAWDITWMFYDQEEVSADNNGLGHFHAAHPDWFRADFAVLGEPSQAGVEGGCNGTLRVELRAAGVAAHSARPWRGDNAIHRLAPALHTLAHHSPETRVVDGLAYREALSAVGISGGIAGNVVPDAATLTVNFRFAPDRSLDQAVEYVAGLFPELECVVVDQAAGARPGLDGELAQSLVRASGKDPQPKYGWTDVARFSALGVPAVNFGPGDGSRAHADDERVPIDQLEDAHRVLRSWLRGV